MSNSELSIRESQAVGAACLARYASEMGVSEAEEVKELVRHLFDVLREPELSSWEERGGRLLLPGRGVEKPSRHLEQKLGDAASEFMLLVEAVVEIGLSSLYQEARGQHRDHLERVVSIMRSAGFESPLVEEVLGIEPAMDGPGWGLANAGEVRSAGGWLKREVGWS